MQKPGTCDTAVSRQLDACDGRSESNGPFPAPLQSICAFLLIHIVYRFVPRRTRRVATRAITSHQRIVLAPRHWLMGRLSVPAMGDRVIVYAGDRDPPRNIDYHYYLHMPLTDVGSGKHA